MADGKYIYSGLAAEPNITKVLEDVSVAAFSQQIDQTRASQWAPGVGDFTIYFDADLTADEKVELDTIVANSLGKKLDVKQDSEVISAIFDAATPLQQSHLLDALDSYPSWQTALKQFNYPLALMRMQKAFDEGALDADELALVQSKTPTGEWITIE